MYVLQIIIFWGFPIGVNAEPMFAAKAIEATAFGRLTFVILEIVNTSGINTNIAVSFIITADDKATTITVTLSSLNSESPKNITILWASLPKTPESSSPLEIIRKEVIAAKLS